ncbi:MAG TPA: hypothetical protein VIY69_14180 [Candidatus Acidoferrales bacterium]
MRRIAGLAAICLGCSFVATGLAHGQGRGSGTWSTAGGDPQLTGFQHTEPRLTRDTVKKMKFLWKLKLGSEPVTEASEPLFAGHTITNAGFKDMVVVLGPGNTLTNVDYELGTILWHRSIPGGAKASSACANGQLSQFIVQPTPTFGGGRGRGARGAAPAPIPTGPPANPPVTTPRVGGNLAGGVGFGGLRGIFVLTPDGNLHEQELNNGWDYGDPVKFMPAGADLGAPTIEGSTIYASAGGSCGGSANGVYALDMANDSYDKASFDSGNIPVTGTDGPALSTDSKTLFVTTGSGSGDAHANSVVALDAKTMQVKDYFAPNGASGKTDIDVSPVVFSYKDRELVAAYVAGGRLALLDAASLGGSDHHTPLFITAPLSKDGGEGAWGRLASAEDADGTRFVYVSVNGSLAANLKMSSANGPNPNGAIIAFKVQDQGDKPMLLPAWVSPDIVDPSPASIVMNAAPPNVDNFGQALPEPATAPPAVKAGGIVFALSEGEPGKTHARLYGFDAETGAQVYSSGDEIASDAKRASIAISGAHVVFLAADNTLYGFGIAYEKN